MNESKPSWFKGLISREGTGSDTRLPSDGFDDFWKAHGSRVYSESDKGQLALVYRAFKQNPAVTYEDSKASQMLEYIKSVLGGPETPPPAAPAVALEVPKESAESLEARGTEVPEEEKEAA